MSQLKDAILYGTHAARPSDNTAGTEGRLYYETDTHLLFRDNGAGWDNCEGVSGMTNPMTTEGDVIYGGSSGTPTRLAKATNGDVLTLTAGVPAWVAPGSASANHAYYGVLCALLEPDAIEVPQIGAFTYAIAANETKYIMSSYWTRIGSAGRFEVRDPKKPAALRGVTLYGLDASSSAFICNPALMSYADARAKYYDRLLAIDQLPTKTVNLIAPSTAYLWLPGPYGSIITRVVNFDFTWIITRLQFGTTGIGPNLANEISDTASQRNDNALLYTLKKGMAACVQSGAERAAGVGLGTVAYVILPANWQYVADPNTYDFRDDFMGAAIDTATVWTRVQSSAGNVEIDTNFAWCKLIGNGSWGNNGLISQASIARAAGKIFMCDLYFSTVSPTTQSAVIVGFHDGSGQAVSDYCHGLLFYYSSGYKIDCKEAPSASSVVGSGWTPGYIYRIRITLTGNSAAYAIQGGTEYPAIGGATWTDISPVSSSNSTTPLYAGAQKSGTNTTYLGDVKIY